MTTQTAAAEVKVYLENNLGDLVDKTPRATTDTMFKHPPQVNGCANDFEDSSGTLSWYSNSASTFATDEYGDEYMFFEDHSTMTTTNNNTKFAYYHPTKSYADATLANNKKRSTAPNVTLPSTDTTSYTSSITPDESAEIASIRLLVTQYQADLDRKDREYQAALAEERKIRDA